MWPDFPAISAQIGNRGSLHCVYAGRQAPFLRLSIHIVTHDKNSTEDPKDNKCGKRSKQLFLLAPSVKLLPTPALQAVVDEIGG